MVGSIKKEYLNMTTLGQFATHSSQTDPQNRSGPQNPKHPVNSNLRRLNNHQCYQSCDKTFACRSGAHAILRVLKSVRAPVAHSMNCSAINCRLYFFFRAPFKKTPTSIKLPPHNHHRSNKSACALKCTKNEYEKKMCVD